MIPIFRNITYPYQTADDTFVARGYHLNLLRDEILRVGGGLTLDMPSTGASTVTDILLGFSADIDAAFIDYKYFFPLRTGTNIDQTGSLNINNSLEHAVPGLQGIVVQRESVNHDTGYENLVTMDCVKITDLLYLRVTNTTTDDMVFIYSQKFMKYESN